MNCKHCESTNFKKNGNSYGKQRYLCKECKKTFFDTAPKYTKKDKHQAILMYLNNCGIRKIALFMGCSHTTIANWIRDAKRKLDKIIEEFEPNFSEKSDIIELDEIYTFVKKNKGERPYGLLILETRSVLLRL